MNEHEKSPLIFPKWVDSLRPVILLVLGVAPLYIFGLVYYGGSPRTTDVGYMPKQPVPYSHALHAGKLGIDCRYCHTTVEHEAFAAVPPTQTCMNCHTNILPDSPKLLRVRESYGSGLPVEWVKIHDLPDYAYFNHSAHVRRGVGCVSCHGRVDKMEEVWQDQKLTMGWCLDCHRNPEPNLRPLDKITDMAYVPGPGEGARIREELNLNPSEDCSTCHR